MVGYIFCVFNWKYPFWAGLVQKVIKLKFVTGTDSNVPNSLAMFTFSVFEQKKIFCWANFVKQIKIVSLN